MLVFFGCVAMKQQRQNGIDNAGQYHGFAVFFPKTHVLGYGQSKGNSDKGKASSVEVVQGLGKRCLAGFGHVWVYYNELCVAKLRTKYLIHLRLYVQVTYCICSNFIDPMRGKQGKPVEPSNRANSKSSILP